MDVEWQGKSNSQIHITGLIGKTRKQSFPFQFPKMGIQNVPADMTLTVSPSDMISVTVHSVDNTTVDITESDIQATADFSACEEPGNYEIPVEITLPSGYELTSEVVLVVTSAQPEATVESAAEASEG